MDSVADGLVEVLPYHGTGTGNVSYRDRDRCQRGSRVPVPVCAGTGTCTGTGIGNRAAASFGAPKEARLKKRVRPESSSPTPAPKKMSGPSSHFLVLLALLAAPATCYQPVMRPPSRVAASPRMSLEAWESRLLPEQKAAMRGTPMPWKLTKRSHTRKTRTVAVDDFFEETPSSSKRVSAASLLLDKLFGK